MGGAYAPRNLTRGSPFDNDMISALTLFSQVSYRRTTLNDLLPATFALAAGVCGKDVHVAFVRRSYTRSLCGWSLWLYEPCPAAHRPSP